LGWGFILLGILGLFLPLLQGVLLILIGLYVLSSQSRQAARLIGKVKKRFPKLSSKLSWAKAKAEGLRVQLFDKKGKRCAD
jgi:uncharacterized membrane protein YbaN (DUF454 family)